MFRCSFPLVVLLVVGVGCGSSAKPLPGSMCQMNSDCHNPLSCTYGRCHVTCKEARDCDPGEYCGGAPGAGVCLLPDEQKCGLNSDCPGELFCAIDLKCRTQCENERDCATPTQKCVPSVSDANVKVCAEPPELEDDMLTPAPPPDGGVSPDAGDAPDAGADAGDDAPGSDAGADAAVESVPDGGDAGQSGDAADAGGMVVSEIEPNEDRNQANPYTPGTTVRGSIGSAADVDFYETTAPASDLAGGYYQASITDVGEGALRAVVYTATDSNIVHQVATTTNGASLFFFWAAAPEQKYRIAINRSGNFSASYDYTLKVQYTKVNDTFEPNPRDAPKTIALGTPITAYFFTGFKTMKIDVADYQDWFAVELAAGTTTVRIDNVATNWRPLFEMIDAVGNPFTAARAISSADGAGINHTFMVTTPGMYRAVIHGYGNQSIAEAGNAMTPSDNFTRPYTLTISQ